MGLERNFRGLELIQSLARLGLESEIYFGIDGRLKIDHILKDWYSPKRARRILRRDLTIPEVACALGHLGIYNRILESGAPWALVFEDDAVIKEGFNIHQVELPNLDFPQVILLQGINFTPVVGTKSEFNERRHQNFLLVDSTDFSVNDSSLPCIRFLGIASEIASGTFGYLINHNAAKIAVENSIGIDSPADWPYRWRNKINFAVTVPNLVGVNLESSEIEEFRRLSIEEAGWLGKKAEHSKFLQKIKTLLGVLGFLSVFPAFRGHNLMQHRSENYFIPFISGRVRNVK